MKRLFGCAALLSFAAFLYVSAAGIRELHGAYRLQQEMKRIENEAETEDMRFQYLQRINPDLLCLLKWGDLLYLPVVQTDNNSFYLTHAFDGTYSTRGSAFMDAACTRDDEGIMILGHHVFDDENAVFSPLFRLYESVPAERIILQYEDLIYEYEFLCVRETDNGSLMDLDPLKKMYDAQDLQRLNSFMNCESCLEEGDRLLILQTCADPAGERKLLVFAKLAENRCKQERNESFWYTMN